MTRGARSCANCPSYPPRMSEPDEVEWRWLASMTLQIIGWVLIAMLGLIVLVRALAWDEVRLFADVDAATEVLFLPAWLVLAGALLGRKWWMAGAAALLCAAQMIYVAPEVLAYSSVPAAVRSEPSIRLFDANVQQDNFSMSGYVAQLRSYRPDLVTLEETASWDFAQFSSSGAFDHLPYRFTVTDTGSRGFIIASRYPLGHPTVLSVHGLAYMVVLRLSVSRAKPAALGCAHDRSRQSRLEQLESRARRRPRGTGEVASAAPVDGGRLQRLLGKSRFPGHSLDGPHGRGGGAWATIFLHVESASARSASVHTNRPRPHGRQPHRHDDQYPRRSRKRAQRYHRDGRGRKMSSVHGGLDPACAVLLIPAR